MKKHDSLIRRLALFAVACSLSAYSFAQTEINTRAGLEAIANDLKGSYKLIADIDLSDSPWTPIGSYDTSRGGPGPFTGTFDGNGHIITGLNYNNKTTSDDYPKGNNVIGLFSAIGSGSVVKNLGLENANVIARQKSGIIVGIIKDGGIVENCYVANSYVETEDHVGSIAGQVRGGSIVRNCWSNADVYSRDGNAGGLVGMIRDASKISKCYFSGMVRAANSCPAGIVATRADGTPSIEYCVNLAPYILGPGNFRLSGTNSATLISNYSLAASLLSSSATNYNGAAKLSTTDSNYGATARHGANIPGDDSNALQETFYTDGSGIDNYGGLAWDFTNTWSMPVQGGYPVLKWEVQRAEDTKVSILKIIDTGRVYEERPLDLTKLVVTGRSDALEFTCADSDVKITDGVAYLHTNKLTKEKTVTINLAAKTGFKLIGTTTSFKITLSISDIPVYPEGTISSEYNAGPGMALDKTSTTQEDSKMDVIAGTSLPTFNAYISTLLSNGFTQLTTNTMENNVFYLLKKGEKLYYLYYSGTKQEVRIIRDNSTRTLLADLDAKAQGTGKTEFYSYSLDYTLAEGQTTKTDYWKIDCGALIIIKLKDNSLFVIDSGHERQSSNAAMEGLLKFMYEITGQKAGSTLNIRGWFFSHAHGDHVYMVYPFVTKYHDVLNVESVLFNIPSYQTMSGGYGAGTFLMKETLNTYFPDCKYAKLHSGETFTLQGVRFDVLYTHEDAVDTSGKTTITDFNSTSTVLKVTIDGKSFMLLGDATEGATAIMLNLYSSATLKSDCVQTGHHGYNNLTNLYNAIAAPLVFFSNSEQNAGANSGNKAKYNGAINAAPNAKAVFSDPNTIKITVENGKLVTTEVPSYRSYFTTVTLPNLNKDTTVGGTKANLKTVLEQPSLLDQVIDKSITGTASIANGEVCSLILDGKTSTKYCTDIIPSTIAWTMKQPVLLKWYVIYAANDNETRPGRNPKNWILCGSNDAKTWETIDYVENGALPEQNYAGTAFAITHPKPYRYYAFKTFTTESATILQMSEIGLYGDENVDTSIQSFDNELPVVVTTEGKNQISVNYSGAIASNTQLAVYDLTGQKITSQPLTLSQTLLSLPTNVYIVEVSDSNGCTAQKVIVH